MTIPLLDVNGLVALAWPNHVHHVAASRWFSDHHEQGWATCPLTESGFIRVSTNHRITPDARSVDEAASMLAAYRQVVGHTFWTDDVSLAMLSAPLRGAILGHRQVTDAHLIVLAQRHRGTLATFDAEAGRLAERLGADAAVITSG